MRKVNEPPIHSSLIEELEAYRTHPEDGTPRAHISLDTVIDIVRLHQADHIEDKLKMVPSTDIVSGDEAVKRVARAIQDADENDHDCDGVANGFSEDLSDWAVHLAKVAIAAMEGVYGVGHSSDLKPEAMGAPVSDKDDNLAPPANYDGVEDGSYHHSGQVGNAVAKPVSSGYREEMVRKILDAATSEPVARFDNLEDYEKWQDSLSDLPREIPVVDGEKLACIAADVAFEVTECSRKGQPVIGRIAAMLRPYLRTTEPDIASMDAAYALGKLEAEAPEPVSGDESKRLKAAIGGLRSIAYGDAQTWPNCSSREVAKQALKDCGGEKHAE